MEYYRSKMYEYTSRNEFFKYLSSLPQRQNERAILDTRLLRLTIPTNIAKLVQIHKKKALYLLWTALQIIPNVW